MALEEEAIYNSMVTLTTNLTDVLVVVTNRVEHERDALGVRREGSKANHEW
jgi:hypothetical protein